MITTLEIMENHLEGTSLLLTSWGKFLKSFSSKCSPVANISVWLYLINWIHKTKKQFLKFDQINYML